MRSTRENHLQRESDLAVETALHPWSIWSPPQGHDFGRDGFVQIIERGDLQPETFLLQNKATDEPFTPVHSVTLETAHLKLWAHERAQPLVLAIWSRASNRIRWRSASAVVVGLDIASAGWRQQKTVSVPFRREDEYPTPAATRAAILTIVRKEVGARSRGGGLQTQRRVLISDVYHVEGESGWTIGLATQPGGAPTGIVRFGPAWATGEVDDDDVEVGRVVTAATFLYEEIWFDLAYASPIIQAIGVAQFRWLLESLVLVPYRLDVVPGFVTTDQSVGGAVVALGVSDDDARFGRQIAAAQQHVPHDPGLAESLRSHTRAVKDVAQDILDTTCSDLASPAIRQLLHLGPFKEHLPTKQEPAWNAVPVARLLHLNTALAVSQSCGLDVVELEAGLARLASEKLYARASIQQKYRSSEAFDSVLRSAGIPDIGRLARRAAPANCVRVARSTAAQDFRDWFWGTMKDNLQETANLSQRFVEAFSRVHPGSRSAINLAAELKLRLPQAGADVLETGPGQSTRSSRGREALQHQARFQKRRKLDAIATRIGRIPLTSEPCPCGSTLPFSGCCGH